MSDLDLIPAEYRRRRAVGALLRGFGTLCLALGLAVVAARVAVAQRLRSEHATLVRLESQHDVHRARANSLRELLERKERAQRRIQALAELRGEPSADEVFVLIDRALDPGVWLQRWTYGPEAAEEPKPAPGSQREAVPLRLSIIGQARTHSALAAFVRNLFQQPGVAEVRVQRTGVRQYTASEVVDFEVAVGLAPAGRG